VLVTAGVGHSELIWYSRRGWFRVRGYSRGVSWYMKLGWVGLEFEAELGSKGLLVFEVMQEPNFACAG
jgi:hypothetical protein